MGVRGRVFDNGRDGVVGDGVQPDSFSYGVLRSEEKQSCRLSEQHGVGPIQRSRPVPIEIREREDVREVFIDPENSCHLKVDLINRDEHFAVLAPVHLRDDFRTRPFSANQLSEPNGDK